MQLKRMIVQTYGFEHAHTLLNLEKAGLLKRREGSGTGGLSSIVGLGMGVGMDSSGSSPWQLLRRQLRLIAESGADVSGPAVGVGAHSHAGDDLTYVAAGYAPLSVRLVQAAGIAGSLSPKGVPTPIPYLGAVSLEGVMRLLPGPLVEISQQSEVVDATLGEAAARYYRCYVALMHYL
jgi:hypothetical protein